MYDLNDAQPQMGPIGELIPDGTFAKIKMAIRPGGVNGSTPMDAGLLKASQSSDAKMLDCEFTVVEGQFARRKFWQNFTVAGGKLDEKGQSKGWNISKSTFRAMVDSALGLDPKDMSPAAKQKRLIQGLKQLDGIVFAGRIMIEPAANPQHRDSNKLANVVLPGEAQYAAIMKGEAVPPEPINAKPRKPSETIASPAPAWATQAAPATAAPAAGSVPWTNQQTAGPAKPAGAPGPAWLNG
jgi:hypothetical protein